MRLYLIRHGETDLNRSQVMQGHDEVPLSDLGIAQATALGRRLSDVGLDLIVSSDLRRAAMTACVLASHTGAPITYDTGFRERDPGELTGKPYADSMPFFLDRDYVPPGGEGFIEFEKRVDEAFERLTQSNGSDGAQIAVVTHGMVCRAFARALLGDAAVEKLAPQWVNTSLSILDYDGQWHIVRLADASHLENIETLSMELGSTSGGA